MIGLIFILIGVAMLTFKEKRQSFVRYSIEYQNKHFGYNFSEKTINLYVKLSFLFCLLVIILGLLTLLGLDDELGLTTK